MDKLFIFDLDGTLADINHRLRFINCAKPDWSSFFKNCTNDKPKKWVTDLLDMVKDHGEILILSGRSNKVENLTSAWLADNYIWYNYLVMRPDGNHQPDEILKLQMLKDFLKGNAFEVQFIVDDRQKVVDMWRNNGYNVLQCEAWEESK